jgi:hypothetical protein
MRQCMTPHPTTECQDFLLGGRSTCPHGWSMCGEPARLAVPVPHQEEPDVRTTPHLDHDGHRAGADAAALDTPVSAVPTGEPTKTDEDLHARIGRSSQPGTQDHAPTGDASSPVGSRNDHQWVRNDPRWPALRGVTFCRVCGVCQRADGKNKPCSGKTPTIAFRASVE